MLHYSLNFWLILKSLGISSYLMETVTFNSAPSFQGAHRYKSRLRRLPRVQCDPAKCCPEHCDSFR